MSVALLRRCLAVVTLTLVAGSCSAGVSGTAAPDPAAAGWSVRSALAGLPAAAVPDSVDTPVIVVGDLDAASTLAGLDRPVPGADADTVADWALTLGARGPETGVAVLFPDAVAPETLAQSDDILDELGWNLANVHSYAEIEAPPYDFSVLTGDFDPAQLTAAMGDRVDGVWRIGPETDGERQLSDRTAARQLGQSLRTGLRDDTIAVSYYTDPVTQWLAGTGGLDSDPALAPLAAALDRSDVYAAMLLPDAAAMAGSAGGLDTFEALAVGAAMSGGEPVVVISYLFGDADSAVANVDTVRELVENGSTLASERPWSSLLTVNDIAADGPVLTATFGLVDDTSPNVGWQIVMTRDNLVTHR